MVLESFRKNQRWLMIIIATLVIISFAWFYNRADLEKINQDVLTKMYGRPVRKADVERTRDLIALSQQLGLRNITSPEFWDQNYPWNAVVLEHESTRLGIQPSETAIMEGIKGLPGFQTDGSFDPKKYSTYLGENASLRGFRQKLAEEAVRTDLQFARVRQMLDAGAVVSNDEVRALFDEINGKVETMVVRLKLADFSAVAPVTDEDVKKYFEDPKNKPALQKDARRKVKFVALELSDDDKKLAAPEKRKVLQKIADQMDSLSQAMLETGADFGKVTAGLGLSEKVKETVEFDRESITKLPEANVQGFMQAALALTPENPVSDVLQSADTFHFLFLNGFTPERELSLEEATAQVKATIQEERGRLALEAKASEARARIVLALKEGKSFADAATSLGLKAETFPAFALTEPNFEFPDSSQVVQATFDLPAGEASKPIATPEGAVIVYLVKRVPPAPEKFEAARDGLANSLRQRKRMMAAREWLRAGRDASGAQLPELRN